MNEFGARQTFSHLQNSQDLTCSAASLKRPIYRVCFYLTDAELTQWERLYSLEVC